MKISRLFVLLALLVPGFAQAIVNGEAIPAEKYGQAHPGSYNTVALMKESVPGNLKAFCTGSIVEKNLILTAKHCVNGKSPAEMKIYFGPTQDDIDPRLVRAVDRVFEFGQGHHWQNFFPNKDMAVVRIQGVVPEGFDKIEILRDPRKLNQDLSVTIVGYGNTVASVSEIKAGTKLTADVGLQEYIHNAHFYHLLLLQGRNGQGACHGDSGGPAYVYLDDRWYIIGVTNGFDLALTPETVVETGDDLFPLRAHCDKGQVLYSFAGVHWRWFERETGTLFTWSPENNEPVKEEIYPQDRLNTFTDWCEKVDHENPDWLTVKQLMLEAVKRKDKSRETDRDVFFDCARAEQILAGVEELDFDKDSFFTGLAPFASLKNLKRLSITDRDLSQTDFSVLRESDGLRELRLWRANITDLSGVAKLKNHGTLRGLRIEDGELIDLSPLAGWTSLEEIAFTKQKIAEIGVLAGLTGLKRIELAGNRIADVSAVSSLGELEVLDLQLNPIGGLPDMSAMTRLRELWLSNTGIEDLSALNGLPLEELNLNRLPLKAWDVLAGLSRLKVLRANETGISTTGFLARLSSLENLELSGNGIERLDGMAPGSHPNLRRVLLTSNLLKDLSPLAVLPDDSVLWLNANPITSGKVAKTEEACPTVRGPERLRAVCRK